jgi:acyl-CoA synthetase (NDP forming)
MLDVAEYCLVSPTPANERAVIVTVSGGLGILMADAAEEVGLVLPPIDDAVAGRLKALLPFAPVGNPYDTTAQVGAVKGGLDGVTDILLDGTDAATVLLYIAQMPAAPRRFEPTRAALTALRERYPDRCLVLVGPSDPSVRDRVVADGLMMFTDASRAMVAAGAAAAIAASRRRLRARTAVGDGRRNGLERRHRTGTSGSLRARADIGSEVGAKAVLADAGLPMLPETLCTSRDEAVAAATMMGLPVVAKIVSPDIAHKTEVGGVLLGLTDPQAVAAAFDTLMDRARQAAPAARLDGVLIAPMAGEGLETILGVHRDPVFGPMVLFGLGGIAVELYKDVAFASAPLDIDGARALICRVKAAQLLAGWRGSPPLDTEALAATLVTLSRFAVEHADELDGVDLNPVLVRERGVVCLDALITLRPNEAH